MKKMICNILNVPKYTSVFIVFASLAILSAALISQYGFGLHPCILCIYQRIPYVFAIAFGTLSYAAHRTSPKMMFAFLMLAVIALFIDAGIAGYHVGVENKWWEGTSSCGQSISTDVDLDVLLETLLAQPVVRCDEVAWSLLGISMAGYNALIAFSLALIGLRSTLINANK